MNRKIILTSVLIGALSLFSKSLNAEQTQAVYVVDLQKVISTSLAGKAARNNMEAEIKKSEARLAAQKQEVSRLKDELAKQQAILSKDALEAKGETLKKKQRELELGLADEQDKLKRKNSEEIEKVLADVRKLLKEMSEDGEYPVIIEKDPRLVVYVSPGYDLTDKVVAALDKEKLG